MSVIPVTELDYAAEAVEGDPILGYQALPGVSDEMLDRDGQIRPVWQNLISSLSCMSEGELHERFARADRYLRDAGVFYRSYADREVQSARGQSRMCRS